MSSARLQQLLAFLEETPNDPFVLFALAQEYQKTGNLAQALQCYEQLHLQHPNEVGTYYHFAKLVLHLGEKEKAIALMRSGIAVAGQQSDFHAKAELQNLLFNTEMDLEDE